MKYRQLNAQERSVLAALRTVGLTNAEIARELGCSPGAARVLVFRGLRHLNRLLGDADARTR